MATKHRAVDASEVPRVSCPLCAIRGVGMLRHVRPPPEDAAFFGAFEALHQARHRHLDRGGTEDAQVYLRTLGFVLATAPAWLQPAAREALRLFARAGREALYGPEEAEA